MPDPKDLNLNELVDLVKSAFTIRGEAVPSDDIVRALARVVKGVLVAENVLVRAGVSVAA